MLINHKTAWLQSQYVSMVISNIINIRNEVDMTGDTLYRLCIFLGTIERCFLGSFLWLKILLSIFYYICFVLKRILKLCW